MKNRTSPNQHPFAFPALLAVFSLSMAAQGAVTAIGPAYFDTNDHDLLDFTNRGSGDPVQAPGGPFDMLIEYGPLGLQFDNAAFFGLQWRMSDSVTPLTGAILDSVSAPVVVDSFGMTTVAFDDPVRAAGIVLIAEELPIDIFMGATDAPPILVDESFIIATEHIGAATYHAYFLGIESDEPFSSFSFGFPAGGTAFIDDLRYILAASPCPGDLNDDGTIDTADLGLLVSQFGIIGSAHDINGDGVIDTADLGILISEFGSDCP